MGEIRDLNVTDESNTARWAENMLPSQVNNSARADEGMLARAFKDTIDGIIETAGSGSAYTLACNRSFTASATMYDGAEFSVRWHAACADSPTLNVKTTDARQIRWPDGTTLSASDILAGTQGKVKYRTSLSAWVLMDAPVPQKNNLGHIINGKSLTTTVTGSAFIPIISKATGEVHRFLKANLASDKFVQRITPTPYTTASTLTNTVPNDDSAPTSGEGDEIFSQAITASNASNIIRIRVNFNFASNGANGRGLVWLLKDGTNIRTEVAASPAGELRSGSLYWEGAAGDTSSHTYAVRCGPDAGSLTTLYPNGISSGRRYGGTLAWTMVIEEVRP